MAAAAAKTKTKTDVEAGAKAAGIPRGRLVALAAFLVFVFGGNWVIVAGHIADEVGRCLAADGPVWGDGKCRHLMIYPPTVALVSLLLMLLLCIREAQAESEVRKAAAVGAQVYPYRAKLGFVVGPESRHLRGSDAMALAVMIAIFLCCMMEMAVGLAIQYAGSRRQLLQHPADEGAAATLAEAGSSIALAGCLALWLEYCCLVAPCLFLRLRRFVRDNWDVSLSA